MGALIHSPENSFPFSPQLGRVARAATAVRSFERKIANPGAAQGHDLQLSNPHCWRGCPQCWMSCAVAPKRLHWYRQQLSLYMADLAGKGSRLSTIAGAGVSLQIVAPKREG